MSGRYNYRIKCEKCGLFVNREEISFNYGRRTCKNCLREQTISKTYQLYVPSFAVKQAGIKPYDKVTITNTEEGEIIIKKKPKK